MKLEIILIFNILVFSFDLSKSDNEIFNEYKLKFAKKYKNNEEELKRKLLFIERLKIIKENNNNPNRLNTFGINKFTDRFDDELPKTGLNHNLKKLKSKNINLKNENLKSTFSIEIPDSYFSCDKINNMCGKTIDQGKCGSCYAAAIINDAQIRYNYIKKHTFKLNEKLNDIFSIQYLLDCGSNTGCDGGYSDETILNAKLLIPENEYPYEDMNTTNEKISHECKIEDKDLHPVMYVYDLTYFSNLDWESIKALIYNKGSFITSMFVSDLFKLYYSIENDYLKYSIWNCDVDININGTNHAVIVDGYGEEIVNGKNIKYLWVRNSWGDDWGDNGHFKINFDMSCGINDKINLGYIDEYLNGTYEIINFVPDYTFYENKSSTETVLSVGIIICIVIIFIIFILFVLSLITIAVLSIFICKLRN